MFKEREAGHFLIACLLGILPKGYTLSSLETFKKERSLNVQVGTTFVDFELLELDILLKRGFTQKKADTPSQMVCTEHLILRVTMKWRKQDLQKPCPLENL
ncbi:hypothetical protein HS088_TW11G00637 [Tripterygium wilfordii]|uniref:Uncharacterized protein n=1 Tax=Tripterygium wilfordii TaxID=458696 RepID=A0A7J7D2L4_TRIWF|nr:hypothetical protein HS088_TW11G00637 [Tripterygium wilfordii]